MSLARIEDNSYVAVLDYDLSNLVVEARRAPGKPDALFVSTYLWPREKGRRYDWTFAGQPLRDLETMLNLIRTTTTQTALTVTAYLILDSYAKGIKISDKEMRQFNLVKLNPGKQVPPKNSQKSANFH